MTSECEYVNDLEKAQRFYKAKFQSKQFNNQNYRLDYTNLEIDFKNFPDPLRL